jgi:hypothetical protein
MRNEGTVYGKNFSRVLMTMMLHLHAPDFARQTETGVSCCVFPIAGEKEREYVQIHKHTVAGGRVACTHSEREYR